MISGMIGSPFSLDYATFESSLGSLHYELEVVIQVIFIGQFNISLSLFDQNHWQIHEAFLALIQKIRREIRNGLAALLSFQWVKKM